jgi:hypothetical protein
VLRTRPAAGGREVGLRQIAPEAGPDRIRRPDDAILELTGDGRQHHVALVGPEHAE